MEYLLTQHVAACDGERLKFGPDVLDVPLLDGTREVSVHVAIGEKPPRVHVVLGIVAHNAEKCFDPTTKSEPAELRRTSVSSSNLQLNTLTDSSIFLQTLVMSLLCPRWLTRTPILREMRSPSN